MRRILFVVLCVVAVTHGQNRGSRRFTPSPFLEGQDLGFLPSRYTTARPGSGHRASRPRPAGRPGVNRRRPTTPVPALGVNDIDDGFGAVSAAKEGVRRVPAVTAKRQPQGTRTAVRRRRPTRVRTVTATAPDVQEAVQTTSASVSTTARPARLRTASKATESNTLSLQRQAEVRKKQAQSSTRRLKGRRVKKIKRIIHPEGDDGDDDSEKNALDESREEAGGETGASSEASDESSRTTTQSPTILRRQKKIFRGRGQQRGRDGGSRRQFSSRRRVVTQAPPTLTEAAEVGPTTVPTVVIRTSSPFEPFLQEENEVDNSKSDDASKKSANEASSGVSFTQLTSSAGGEFTRTSSSSSSSASSSSAFAVGSNSQSAAGSGLNEDSSANEVESSTVEDISSNEATVQIQGVRRPASRGSVRSSVRGSSTVARARGRQGASRRSGRGRARGSGRQTVTSSSSSSSVTGTGSISSSARGTSRRKFTRRRRPSTSGSANAVTSRTPVTTTTTTAATFTTTSPTAVIDTSSVPATEQTFQTNRFTSTSSLESEAPSRGQGTFNVGPTAGAPSPSAGPVTTIGGFRPVTSSGSFRFGSGAVTRFGASPRPVSTTFPPTFQPTTPAVPAQVFGGNSGNQGFGQSTPESTTLLSNTIGGSDFRPTTTQEPVAFFSSGPRGAGSGRPSFGSFSFGNAAGSSSSSSSDLTSFNGITTTARPVTFRPTTARTATTTFGFDNAATVSEDRRFGSQPVSTSGGFRPSSFPTSRPAPTLNTNTDNNVRISSNGAFSFGTGLANPSVSGPGFGAIDPQTTTPNSAFPTVVPFTSFESRPTATSARAPAVLTGASRFFGTQPGPAAQTAFGAAGSSRGSVSSFTHGAVHPAPATSSGSFSFGTAVTEASTLVQSLATSPATLATTTPTSRPQTFRPVTERAQIFHSVNGLPVSHTAQQVGQTFVSHRQRQGTDQFQHQDSGSSSASFSSSSSSSSQGSSGSGRPANAGRSFGSSSSSSSNNFFDTGRVTGFEFQQENGVITRSSHLRGFDTRLPKFHENVVISDPVFSSKDIKPGFTCENKPYGYYADEANDCRIFHICQPVDVSSISTFYTRYSFFCGSETRFDQSKLSCLHDKDAMPCSESASWLFRNDEFGVQQEPTEEERFLSEVQSAPATV